MKFFDALKVVRPLKTLVHPNIDKLSLRAEEISTSAKAIPITEAAAMIQQKMASTSEDWEESKTVLDLKKIPAPIEEPITTKMAEKKEIFFWVDAWASPTPPVSFLLFDIF